MNGHWILLIIGFFFWSNLLSQEDYIPLINENTYWFVANDPPGGFLQYPGGKVRFLSFGFRGDIIINNLSYKKFWYKLYREQDSSAADYADYFGNSYIETGVMAYFREDTTSRKVYAIYTGAGYEGQCPINEEIELFDFSVSVNDTIQSSCIFASSQQFVVEDIQLSTVSSKRVRIFNLNLLEYPLPFSALTIIEGMGSKYGPIGPRHVGLIAAEGNIRLVHYCEDLEQNCIDRIVETNDIKLASFEVKPNPTSDFIIVNIKENLNENVTICIRSLEGKK